MNEEFRIIRDYFQRAGAARGLAAGIGDDGAVLRPAAGFDQVIVTDTLVEGRHFPAGFAAEDIGWRALAVNLSDIAAMGATPRFAFLNLSLPAVDDGWLAAFSKGFFDLADAHGVVLAGGDTTRGPLCMTVTVTGDVSTGGALLRGGAHPGDLVCVSGTLGGAAAGLECLQASTSGHDALVERFRRPEPRIALGERLAGRATAAIDISDGLLADLGHLVGASGTGARIEVARLPLAPGLEAFSRPIDYALNGGDDYELCFTLPVEAMDTVTSDEGVTVIGEITAQSGIVLLDADGERYTPRRGGWQHFETGAT